MPAILAIVYYGFIAADIYVSESRFVIRDEAQLATPAPITRWRATPPAHPHAQLLGWPPVPSLLTQPSADALAERTSGELCGLAAYLRSMDVLRALEASTHLRARLGAPHGDFASRFPAWSEPDASDARLLRYYRAHVLTLSVDRATGIATLQTAAFDARDAQALNEHLLALGQARVAQLNQYAGEDLMHHADTLVHNAQLHLEAAARALAGYRVAHHVFDPQRQSLLLLQQIDRLQQAWLAAQARVAEVQVTSPHDARLVALRTHMAVLDAQISAISARLTGNDGASLAEQSPVFGQLELAESIAAHELASALVLRDTAQEQAAASRLRLVRIVEPQLPDAPAKPRRARIIFTVFMVCLASWCLVSLVDARVCARARAAP
jgi:capsular polysaccharide transport system permease protein